MKLVVNVVTVVVMVVVMRGGVGVRAASCEPDCTGKVLGDKVINPKNCSEYYICIGDGVATDHAVPCEDGNFFDEAKADCVPNGADPCVSPCGGGSAGCHLTCNGTLDFISDIADCSKYFICIPGGVNGPHSCPIEHPHFDGEQCGNDKTKCCSEVCEPFCETPNTIIPDPKDCTRYYYCEKEGKPGDTLHFTCPDGWNFNIQLGECSKDATCTVLCNEDPSTPSGGGGGVDTTTSSSSSSGCLDSLTCTSAGYFPACKTCQPEYFACNAAGEQGTPSKCTGDQVFNTNPDYPICVQESNCPYPS